MKGGEIYLGTFITFISCLLSIPANATLSVSSGSGVSPSTYMLERGIDFTKITVGGNTFSISNGGIVEAQGGKIYLSNGSGTTTTIIDGYGSFLRAQQDSDGDGGRINISSEEGGTSIVNITNGGVMEALSGNFGDSEDEGTIPIRQDVAATAIVNVDGEGSSMRADNNYIAVAVNEAGATSQLNITNGVEVEVSHESAYSDGVEMPVATFPFESEAPVSGESSTLTVDDLQISGSRLITGYTADGNPVFFL